MRFIFCIFLSVIGLVSFGETSKKLENGIYHNETSSKLIEIKPKIRNYHPIHD